MKYKVIVTMRAETEIELEVEASEEEDPTDLTPVEQADVLRMAPLQSAWQIISVRQVREKP